MSAMIERLAFAHAGADDFQPVAGSMERSQWRNLASWLRPHVRVGHERRPRMSLIYLRDGTRAAVLCRLAAGPGADNRQDRCLCLIGPQRLLTAQVALRLHDWNGWQPQRWEGTELAPHDVDDLPGDVEIELERDVHSPAAELTAVVAAQLRSPSKPLSIVADTGTLRGRVELLRDMEAVLGDLFEGCDRSPFTFSTFEEQYDLGATHLPQVVFNPPGPMPHSAYQARPQVVLRATTLGELPTDGDRVATELVDRYLSEGRRSLIAFLQRHGVLTSTSFAERIAVLKTLLRGHPDRHNAWSGAAAERPGGPAAKLPRETVNGNAPTYSNGPALDEHSLMHDLYYGDSAQVRTAIEQVRSENEQARSDRRGLRQPGDDAALARRQRNTAGLQKMLVKHRFFEARLLRVLPNEAEAAVDGLARYAFDGDLARDSVRRLLPLLASGDAPLATAALYRLDRQNRLRPLTRSPAGIRWRLGTWLRLWALLATHRSAAKGPGPVPAWVTWAGSVAVVLVLLVANMLGKSPAPAAELSAVQSISKIGHYQAADSTYQVMIDVDQILQRRTESGSDLPRWYGASAHVAAFVDFREIADGPIDVDEGAREVHLPRLRAQLGQAAVDQAMSRVGVIRDGTFQPDDVKLTGADLQQLNDAVIAQAQNQAAATKLVERAGQNAELALRALLTSHGYAVVFE